MRMAAWGQPIQHFRVPFARVDAGELPTLLRKMDGCDGDALTRLAMRLLAYTFVRTSELIESECLEFDLDHARRDTNYRRSGQVLAAPIVKVVERVMEKVIIKQDPQCFDNLYEASKLISAPASKLKESISPFLQRNIGYYPVIREAPPDSGGAV